MRSTRIARIPDACYHWLSAEGIMKADAYCIERTSGAYFQTLIESVPEIIYHLDEDGRFVFVNPAISRLGYTAEELEGRHISAIVHPEDVAHVVRAEMLKHGNYIPGEKPPGLLDERRTGERMTRGLLVRLVPKAGSNAESSMEAFMTEVTAAGVYDSGASGSFLGTIGVARDASDRAEKERLMLERTKIEKYIAGDVLRKITDSQTADLGGDNVRATILFFDVRGFTGLSEALLPHQVADLLSRIYNDVMDLIISHNGSVNKLIGDAILATFGCPFRSGNDAENALAAALDIRETMRTFNLHKPDYLKSDLKYGIGIATGEVFAGNIGSFRRTDYTVIGDVVNIASRFQNVCKRTGLDIVIDEETRLSAGSQFETEPVETSRLRGRRKAVQIHAVKERCDAASQFTMFAPRKAAG